MEKQLPEVVPPLPRLPGRDPALRVEPAVAPALREVPLGAVPREEVGEHDATTRKVANLQDSSVARLMPSRPRDLDWPRRYQIWHAVLVSVVIVGAIVLSVGLRKRTTKTKAVVPAATPSAVAPAKLGAALDQHAKGQPERTPPSPRLIRLEIGVEPAEATLSLDDANVGNRLVVDVPKDQSIHELKASAPGFMPFSQKISYGGDVHLAIQLRRLRVPARATTKLPVARPAVQSRAARSEARPLEGVRPAPSSLRVEAHLPSVLPETPEPGTNLGHPSQRRPSKPIDEKDPYAQ